MAKICCKWLVTICAFGILTAFPGIDATAQPRRASPDANQLQLQNRAEIVSRTLDELNLMIAGVVNLDDQTFEQTSLNVDIEVNPTDPVPLAATIECTGSAAFCEAVGVALQNRGWSCFEEPADGGARVTCTSPPSPG